MKVQRQPRTDTGKQLSTILVVMTALTINLGFFMSLSFLGAMRSTAKTELKVIDVPFSELRKEKRKKPKSTKKLKPRTRPKPSKREKIKRREVATGRRRTVPKPRQLNALSKTNLSVHAPPVDLGLKLDDFGDIGIALGTGNREVVAGHAAAEQKEEYELGEVDAPPRKLSSPPPRYPRLARDREIEGWVRLKLLVGTNGKVVRVEVLHSRPPGVFDDAATNAVRRWSFIPASLGGKSVPTWCVMTISFKLEG
jgi:protein TonB